MKNRWKIGVLGLLICLLLPVSAMAAWKTTASGKMYTTSQQPGYYTGWHTIEKSRYYFTSSGIMVTGWKKIDGKYYYFGDDGKMRTGFQVINEKTYYLGKDGARVAGWLKLKSGNVTKTYYFGPKGVMKTGVRTINKKKYLVSDSGVLQYGFAKKDGKTYYADKSTGELAIEKWVGDYYFQADGTMAVSQWINGKWVGSDGRFTGTTKKIYWITENGITRYYNANSVMQKGFINVSGKKYYLDAVSGALKYGWFKVGNYTYYSNNKGVVQTKKWMGKKYLKSSGAMAKGWLTVNGVRYYFSPNNGEYLTGWQLIGKKYYYFTDKGAKQVSKWIGKYYVNAKGARVVGVQKIGSRYYYFARSKNGQLVYKWIKYNGDIYYAHKTKGYLFRNKFFKKGKYTYYAGSDCKIYRGLKTISGKLYYFNKNNGRMFKNKKKTVSGATYYFGSDGVAVKSKWVKIGDYYYYFQANGKMAVNKKIGNYYVNAQGRREALKTGLHKEGSKYYYYDSNGKKVKGWKTISGNTYYFGSDYAAVTGLQVINSKKYYFQSTGVLAKGQVLTVGSKMYTINSEGVVTKEETYAISGNTTGSKIAQFAIKYVGNPYVWGGTSLTNGADCSGFVYTVFANFGISLNRVADDQMKGGGLTVSTSAMLPGDLVFYGSNNYASHVALYIGNGQIVHASNSQPYPAGGIKISNYDYQTPIRIVRYWS